MTAPKPDPFTDLGRLLTGPNAQRVLKTLREAATGDASGSTYSTSRTETTPGPRPGQVDIDVLRAEILTGLIKASANYGGFIPREPHQINELLAEILTELRERGLI